MAASNGYPKQIIQNLRRKIANKKQQKIQEHGKEHKKWTTFTFFSPLIRQVTKLFKDTQEINTRRTSNMKTKPITNKIG